MFRQCHTDIPGVVDPLRDARSPTRTSAFPTSGDLPDLGPELHQVISGSVEQVKRSDSGEGEIFSASVHLLKATLHKVRPVVWRRLLVPSTTTLAELSELLLTAFDWTGEYLHEFEAAGSRYVPPQLLDGNVSFLGEALRDERTASLAELAPDPGGSLIFTYGLGNDWRHRIVVEAVGAGDPQQVYPTCTDGEGLAPDEDAEQPRTDQFDLAEVRTLLHSLPAGQDMTEPTGAAGSAPFDPVFTGLFPNSTLASDEACNCGEEHDAIAPVLRPYRPVADAVLTELADESLLVEQAVALAEWVGAGRSLAKNRRLPPAEARLAAAQVGLTGAELRVLWAATVEAGLIEVHGARASLGPAIRVWQEPSEAWEKLDGWARLLAGVLRVRAGSADEPGVGEDLIPLSGQLFYTLARGPIPAAMPALLIAVSPNEGPEPVNPFLTALHLPAAMATAADDWIRAGVLAPVDGTDPDLPATHAGLDELMAGLSELDLETRELLEPLVEAVRVSPIVELSPLGDYGLRRLLIAHGWQVPQVGELVGVPARELLDRLAGHGAEDAIVEAEIWLTARGDQWQAALREIAEPARTADPELGPDRRAILELVLHAAGPKVAVVLDNLTADPWLSAIAANVRHSMDLGPEPTLAQQLWLAVDDFVLGLDTDDDDELAEAVQECELVELLAVSPGAVALAAALAHPQARETLYLLADLTEDAQLSRRLQRALDAAPVRRPSKKAQGRRKR
jgi:hypothetical protein